MESESLSPSTIKIATIVILFLSVIAIIAGCSVNSYNQLVVSDTDVIAQKANVQTALEQRSDLIPNIISTIEGSSKFEKTTLVDVVEERNKAFQLKSNVQSANTEEQIQATENNIDSTISRLLLIAEQYPQIKTTDQYLELQNKLLLTEIAIRSERVKYNEAVRNYQVITRSFPTNIIAKMFGFDTNRYKPFEVYQGKDQLPEVQFGL